ncbi:MAG: tetratricopeptide repeat protein [Gemmatimonadaceae bacterium]
MSQPVSKQPTPERGSHLRLIGEANAPQPGETRESLVERAQTLERQGRREEARELFDRALKIPAVPVAEPGATRVSDSAILRWIGRTHQTDGNYELALAKVDEALAAARAAGSDADAGHAINIRAVIHWVQGQLDEAETRYHEARELALRAGERELAAMTAQNLGVIFFTRGDLREALTHYEASLAEYRALGKVQHVWGLLNNLGLTQTDLHRWEAATASFAEALQIAEALGDVSARSILEVSIAKLRLAQGDHENAAAAGRRAFDLARLADDELNRARACALLGVVARERGNYAEAERYLLEAEAVAAERQDPLLLAETLRDRAEVHRRQGKNRDTLQCLNRAHRIFAQVRARRDLLAIGRQMGSLEQEFLEVVRKWGASIESKDRYTQGHCERVAAFACALAKRTGMDERTLFWFKIGALLHDVGKLVVPSEVLNKPGKLTPEEWVLIKTHPTAGVQMLADIEFPWDILPMVEFHHERWDGQGYPRGLAGEDIPVTARVLCIADVYDALTSERAYKAACSHDDAMEIMRREVGTAFDPTLFPLFEEVVRDLATSDPALLAGRRLDPGAPAAVAEPEAAPVAPARRGPVVGRVSRGDVDDLTGVPLRRAFLDRTAAALAELGADSGPVSLLVIDVDHFKLVNDRYGHLQGDGVLRMVADLLRRNVRDTDLVARYAGDEFVALLPGTGTELALEVAERLRQAVHASPCPMRDGSGSVQVSLSIGVATAPHHGDAVESLFAAADRALYESKRRGRNSVTPAGEEAPAAQPHLDIERFVGRDEEVRRMVRLFESAVRGEPQLVAVAGEAGVGKSTLVRQLAPDVRLRGGALVAGRCLEADVRPPYGPWAEIIEQVHALGLVQRGGWRELPRLVPSLGQVQSGGHDPAASRYALLDEIAEYLRLAAQARPLVLLLDDMQWADGSSWDTLEHLQSELVTDRVLVTLTLRAEETVGDSLERRRRLSRDERFHEIVLSRLTAGQTEQWLEAALHRQDVGREFLSFLYEHTEGNPLFVVQVLRTLVDEGAVWHSGQRWEWRPVSELRLPAAVEDLLARRIERLSPETRTILTTCAVIGRSFDIDLAVAAGAATEDDLLDAVDEGVAGAVLEPAQGPRGDRFSFEHGLLVDAILRTANPRRLRRIHERVATALEQTSPASAAEIARHYDAASVGAKAFRYALLAGERAAAVCATEEATALFATALRHAQTQAEVAEVRRHLAAVAEIEGRYAEAATLTDQVHAHLQESGDTRAALAMRRNRERLRALQGEPLQHTLAAYRGLLDEAEAAGLEVERVALLTMISQTHSRLGDSAAAKLLAKESVRLAESVGDRRLLAQALLREGSATLVTDPEASGELYRRALKIFHDLDDRFGEARCYVDLGNVFLRIGDPTEAGRAFKTGFEMGRSARAPDLAGLAALNLGVLEMRTGQSEQATAQFTEALRLFTSVKNEHHRAAALYNLAHLALERGRADEARELYEQTAVGARAVGLKDVEAGATAGAGLAALALGDRPDAERFARDVAELVGNRSDPWFQGREVVEALGVRLAVVAGDIARAAGLFDSSLAFVQRHDPRYAAAWFVSECVPALAEAGVTEVWPVVERFRPTVVSLGLAMLTERYAAMARLTGMRPATPGA